MDQIKAVGIARVAHEVGRAYCQAIGDNSQPTWGEAPQWQRESAVSGVLAHMTKPMTPQESHQSWMEHKAKDGWVFAWKKNPEKKEHPCMVPFEELPQEQRVKDYLFIAVVRTMTGAKGG